jgi:hypothetical protein
VPTQLATNPPTAYTSPLLLTHRSPRGLLVASRGQFPGLVGRGKVCRHLVVSLYDIHEADTLGTQLIHFIDHGTQLICLRPPRYPSPHRIRQSLRPIPTRPATLSLHVPYDKLIAKFIVPRVSRHLKRY